LEYFYQFSKQCSERTNPFNWAQRKELLCDGVLQYIVTTNESLQEKVLKTLHGYSSRLASDDNFAGLQYWDGKETGLNCLQNKDAILRSYDYLCCGGDEKSTFNVSLGYNKTEEF
jgi:hypothetical protein